MKIAILGWGSLLWEGGQQFDEQHKTWCDDGPRLKIEFSRISKSRQRALTLVIDNDNGSETTVAWCLSTRGSVEDAICDLRCREGTTVENIDCQRVSEEPDPTSVDDPVAAWARTRGLDAVIWTALKSNFQQCTGRAFSVDAAVEHIRALDPAGKAKAAEYVWRAPEFVRTPLRDALQREPWFREVKP